MKNLLRFQLLLLGAALWLAVPPVVRAGVFSVSPVRIHMAARDRAVAVTLVNESDSPVVLQADIHTWRQTPEGADELELTEELILSPPIITLAPNARQVVRLARLQATPLASQLTYRLLVREVPEALASPDRSMEVPIALALNMPVFISPPHARRAVDCTLKTDAQPWQARCRNTGTAYAQVRELQLHQGERLVARFEGGSYILPGALKSIGLSAPQAATAGDARLTVVFDDYQTQPFAVQLP